MAKKEEKKTTLEREYTIPLRREWLKSPKYKRSKKATTALKEFLIKHMKPSKDEKGRIQLKIGGHLNDFIWKHGIKNPPHHVKVVAKKDDKGLVSAELFGVKIKEPKKEEKKKAAPKKVEAPKKEDKKEEERKEIEKEELKTIKKEEPKEKAEPKKTAKKPEAKPNAPDHE